MRKLAYTSAVLLVGALVASCETTGAEPAAIPAEEIFVTQEPVVLETEIPATEPPIVTGPIISPDTKVLSGDLVNRYLLEVEGDTYIFSFQISNIVTLESGDVLVGEITEQTPYGFLRRATNITSDGLSLRVETEPAVLEDVFIQADIVTDETPLGIEDIEEYREISGLQMMSMGIPNLEPPGAISIKLKNVVIYDDDLNLDTKEDQVTVNGNISFDPRFKFSTKIVNQQLTDMTFLLSVDETSELAVNSKVDLLDWIAPDPIQVAWYRFKPVIIWVDFVPVFVTPELSLFIGMDGKISASISTGVTQEASLTSGLTYRNGPDGEWDFITPMEGFQPGVMSYQPPEFQYDSEIITYSRAQLQLKIYDLIGPTGKVDGYLKLEITPESNWWKLYNGIKVNIGVTAEVFSHVWFEFSEDIYKGEWLVDQAEHALTEPTQKPAATPSSGNGDKSTPDWVYWVGFAILLLIIYYFSSDQ